MSDQDEHKTTERIFAIVFLLAFAHIVASLPVGIFFGALNGFLALAVGLILAVLGLMGKIGVDHNRRLRRGCK